MEDFKALKEKILKSKSLYEDPHFPADSRSLYFRSESAPSIQWKRPREISYNAKFLVHGASYHDMQQGALGNCWFIAGAVTLAASNWKLFQRVVPLDQDFDNDYAGIFRFNFWQYGEWKEVVVDDRLPTRHGQLIYAANLKETNEFWCPLLEKAYAKLYSCYEAIDGGRIHHALVDMTGGISELIQMQGGISLDKLQTTLMSCKKMNTLMGGSIFNRPGSSGRESKRMNGLYEGHAYSIVDIREIDQEGKRTTLLRLRNPWGRGEWNGPWSDGSPEWRHLHHSDSMTIDHAKIPNGEFWISLEDFQEQYDELEMCHLYPDALSSEIASVEKKKQWSVQEFYGSWIRGVTSGGPFTSFTSKLFWKNPQYKVHLDKADKPISVIVNLMEVSDKQVRDENDVDIGFVIFKLQEGREPVRLSRDNVYEFKPRLEKTSGMFWAYRERTLRFELEPSTYIIVPCTFKASMDADFYLRVMAEEQHEVEPVDTPTGPIGDYVDAANNSLEKLFHDQAGSDERVDAIGLRHVLSELNKGGKSE
ncbi:calpain-A-like [Gigantopelta aegis]|uniref:calpain-A-like n=1 Tax=Gigantopelta aegis TaxID=1735272 RepID=UPI001B88A93B|nr:calpain-A-like [Gigantopelta aegis]